MMPLCRCGDGWPQPGQTGAVVGDPAYGGDVVRGGHDLLDHEVGGHEGQKALGHGRA